MSKISTAIHQIHHLDFLAKRDHALARIHPLAKLFVTIFYILIVVSFPRYNLTGLMSMILYPVLVAGVSGVSLARMMKKSWVVLPILLLLGVSNLWYDRTIIGYIVTIRITGGIVSLTTLVLKGALALAASLLLMATSSMESVCYGLQTIHCPRIIITVLLLIYRYIIVLLKEVERITLAYSMRAPDQKGLHFGVWGALVGQLLLRSIDRAQEVYESMTIRGYDGNYFYQSENYKLRTALLYSTGGVGALLILRFVPLFEMIGKIFI